MENSRTLARCDEPNLCVVLFPIQYAVLFFESYSFVKQLWLTHRLRQEVGGSELGKKDFTWVEKLGVWDSNGRSL